MRLRAVLSSGVILAAMPEGAVAQRTSGDSLAVSSTEYQGWKLFHVQCDRCHGVDASGSSFAPNLRRSVGPDGGVDHDVFIQKTADGVDGKGMPAWKDVLTASQMDAIWAYVRARSSGRLAAGRPHVASDGKP